MWRMIVRGSPHAVRHKLSHGEQPRTRPPRRSVEPARERGRRPRRSRHDEERWPFASTSASHRKKETVEVARRRRGKTICSVIEYHAVLTVMICWMAMNLRQYYIIFQQIY